ncbi:hypothetical protein [Chryseosolibacter indicus]|uniref:SGNH/GDSL hydrolase family protein n=1 Tax=Chryseosolibacter indicus TaxID=2782351 RepID=A0ABS5VTZ1_9BACT|nr:hypothetical protein [Chryseosolibacter indicus]MBT1703456.1 hypothetical protein [Chryseosolibacter indicus]
MNVHLVFALFSLIFCFLGAVDNSMMTFLKMGVGLLLIILLFLALTNYIADIYGLIRSSKGRKLKVLYHEKITKYLFSYRYIPQNFNTVIIGTSLSDSLDVSSYNKTSKTNKVYNGSIMGADITLVYPMVENVVGAGVKNVILCLSPYMMKKSAAKGLPSPSPVRIYTLGTKFLYESYLIALLRFLGIVPNKFPKGQFNEHGVHNYYHLFKKVVMKEKFQQVIDDNKDKPIVKDESAYEVFQSLIEFLDRNKVNYFIYFHPLPKEIFMSKREEYDIFHSRVRSIVQKEEIILDFNDQQYSFITSDYSNYLDHGHLSNKGQKIVTDILCQKLEEGLHMHHKVAVKV